MPTSTLEKGSFADTSQIKKGGNTTQAVGLASVTAVKVTLPPGASWSRDLKPYDGTESCLKGHVGMVLSGCLWITMSHGEKTVFHPDDVLVVPPGHDAGCQGEEAVVFVVFSHGSAIFQG